MPSSPPENPQPAVPEKPARSFTPDFLLEMFANPLDAGYGDAAQRRARLGAPSPRARRLGVGIRTIALVATGLLLTVAYQATVESKPETSAVQNSLVSDVRQRQSSTDAQERQAATLRAEVTKLRNAALNSTDAQALTDLEAVTGLGAVTGDGVIVTMSDGPAPTNPVTGQADGDYLGRVQDADLQAIANELWLDGAEAISINGQRLTSTSTIRRAGDALLVDFVPLQQPYLILAIGPGGIDKTLRNSPIGALYARYIDTYGMHFTIQSHDNLSLPAAPDPQLHYATVPAPSPFGTHASPGAHPSKPSPRTSTPSTVKPGTVNPSTVAPSPSGGH